MPYDVKVIAVSGRVLELELEAEQAESDPFYLHPGFALFVLAEAAAERGGALHDALAADDVDFEPSAMRDAADGFIERVEVRDHVPRATETRGPTARYRVTVRDTRWAEHLAAGDELESHAWLEDGPRLENEP
jgi:hypothetical protein